jgi:hypothetical protein
VSWVERSSHADFSTSCVTINALLSIAEENSQTLNKFIVAEVFLLSEVILKMSRMEFFRCCDSVFLFLLEESGNYWLLAFCLDWNADPQWTTIMLASSSRSESCWLIFNSSGFHDVKHCQADWSLILSSIAGPEELTILTSVLF